MKSFFRVILGVTFVGIAASFSSSYAAMVAGDAAAADLSELRQIVDAAAIPAEISAKLDAFFADPQVREVFIEREKPLMLGWQIDKLKGRAVDTYKRGCSEFRDLFEQYYRPIIDGISSRYRVEIQISGKLFFIKNLIPGFLIKIQHTRVPVLPDAFYNLYTPISPHFCQSSPYQNISRFFYNQKIKQVVAEQNLKQIRLVEKYLYHVPGRPENLCDDNYIVVAEDVSRLLNECNRNDLLADFGDHRLATGSLVIRPVYESLFTELLQVITYAGMWDTGAENLYLVEEHGILKWMFIDTEKPAFTGSEDQYFFHKNNVEFAKNIGCGINGLVDRLEKFLKQSK